MVIILLYQGVLLASASWYAVDITFFEVVIVASCNEYFCLPNKKTKKGHEGQVGGFHAIQLLRHSSPHFRNVCLFASTDDPLANP